MAAVYVVLQARNHTVNPFCWPFQIPSRKKKQYLHDAVSSQLTPLTFKAVIPVHLVSPSLLPPPCLPSHSLSRFKLISEILALILAQNTLSCFSDVRAPSSDYAL